MWKHIRSHNRIGDLNDKKKSNEEKEKNTKTFRFDLLVALASSSFRVKVFVNDLDLHDFVLKLRGEMRYIVELDFVLEKRRRFELNQPKVRRLERVTKKKLRQNVESEEKLVIILLEQTEHLVRD